MARVGLVTCRELPEPDPDERLVLRALRDRGVDVELLAWDDPDSDSSRFDLCILWSCWNYYERPDAFLRWIRSRDARSQLANPANVVRWNLHKSYLHEMERAGVPVVPTLIFERGAAVDLRAAINARGWNDVVVKPAISAASYRTRRFRQPDLEEGQGFLNSLIAERDTMVQRYMPSVESPGERAIVSIDGELTHTVVKSPRLMGDDEQVSGTLAISDQDRAIANQALACVNEELLYARIDVVADGDGALLVSELELIEPSLFLPQNPTALERLAAAIQRRAV